MKFIVRCIIIAAVVCSVSTAALASSVTLRFSSWVSPTAAAAIGFEHWAEAVEKASNGEIEVEVYHAGALGNPRDHYNLARDGIADLAWAVPGWEAGRFPIFSAMEIPFMAKDSVKSLEIFHDWYNQHKSLEMNEVKLCFMTSAPVGALNFNEKITSPDQLKGKRMRPSGDMISRYFTSLGAIPVNLPISEAREAFERGLVDGIPSPWRTLINFGLDKAVNTHMDLPFYIAPGAVVMNKWSYDGLSTSHKKILDDHCSPEWSRNHAAIWEEWESPGRKMLEESGHTIYQVSDAETEAWKSAAAPLLVEWEKGASKKGLKNASAEMEALRTRLRDAGVGY